jgi:uncharacterized membrane protein (DUF373 family)
MISGVTAPSLAFMNSWKRLFRLLANTTSDENVVGLMDTFVALIAKLLSIAMMTVIVISVIDLFVFLIEEIVAEPRGFFSTTLIEIFGLFLNVLIAIEVLENIMAYLKQHVIQVELVIATSLVAVARKIIIFDFAKSGGLELAALAIAIFALSISYWLVRRTNRRYQ